MKNFDNIIVQIENTHLYFFNVANKQVNYAYTLRNWLIGMYLFEYEQKGQDRAEYGQNLYKKIAESLKIKKVKGLSFTMLNTCKQFYLAYPQIIQTVSEQLLSIDNENFEIIQTMSEEFKLSKSDKNIKSISIENTSLFLSKLTFSHILEFIKIDDNLSRSFYEIQTLKNNWTVRQLQREINSMLFERIGLSQNKEKLLDNIKNDAISNFTEIIKSPYILEFLNIPELAQFSESDLEQSIINHLQNFLIELGRGFCFEARQKRISFNNKHYRIDLVFYHRILKCNILIDLKIGTFDHSDAGQMNVYLNYYKENEMLEGDNPPIGIVLCSQKDNALVHYATGGLSQEIFVSKYKLQLPTEEELKNLIEFDMKSFQNKN